MANLTNALTSEIGLTSPYGYFSPETSEYVITNLATPRPWCNVFSNSRFGSVVSHTGGGFAWIDNCQLQRITRWDQDLATEHYGQWIYISNGAKTWSTTYLPTYQKAELEEVRQGLGYTVFERQLNGIRSVQTSFVPLSLDAELRLVSLENNSDQPVELNLASYLEWHLGTNQDWHREFHRLFMETLIEGPSMFAFKHTGLKENSRLQEMLPFIAYHAVIGAGEIRWVGDKSAFVGQPGNLASPDFEVEGWTGRWDDPIAAGIFTVRLNPGEKAEFLVATGAERSLVDAKARVGTFTVDLAKKHLEELKEHWQAATSLSKIETPDIPLNILTNSWLRYQALVGRMDARCAYYQQGGAYGFRDQLQDSLVCLSQEPKTTLEQLTLHSEAMYEDGGVRHWWHPSTSIYVESHHSDTCLWLAYGMLAYLEETDDLSALEIRTRYLNRSSQQFGETGSMLDHIYRGIDRALNRVSARGLPLIGAGDWNDGLSHVGIEGKGESVWMAMFLYKILTEWAPILDELGEGGRAKQFRSAAASLQESVERNAWDGKWYIAGTRDDGHPFGSIENAEGSIFLNTQTWAVLSKIGNPERTKQAMESARDRLIKPYGALLLSPAFAKVDPFIGYITRYAPGLRENGGVYSHASTWAAQAFAELGEVDVAYEIVRSMLPCKAFENAKRYSAEPYVMPGNVDGPDSPFEGRAGWTWYTGSAAWLIRVTMDAICGVKSTRAGLTFGPSPSSWQSYQVQRRFRGSDFEIQSVGAGAVQQVFLNGDEIKGPIRGIAPGNRVQVNLVKKMPEPQ